MNLLKTAFKVVIFAVVAVAVLTIAGKVRQASARNGGAAASTEKQTGDKLSAAGFFLLSRDDAKNPNVVIMSPPNCPSHEAQRALALGDSLAQAGIPHEMRSGIQFQFNNPDDVARMNKYMTDVANPLVLVRGWARGNPSLDQVIAQYRAAH